MRKILALVVGLILWASIALAGPSSYVPIPDYNEANAIPGFNGGRSQTEDTNRHLNGTSAIEPKLTHYIFANLPGETDYKLAWCDDCAATNPCTSGGGGPAVLAFGFGGQWICSLGGGSGGGSSFPLGSDANFNSHKGTGLAAGTASGNTLAFGLNDISDLATAQANYGMASHKFTGLSAGSSAGDSLAQNQSGAILTSLAANINNIISVMAPAQAGTLATGVAVGDGSADDTAAIQSRAYQACNAASNPPTGTPSLTAVKSVYLPTPSVCYKTTAPIRLVCAGLQFYGDGIQSALCPNFAGNAIIQEAWGTSGALQYDTSLVTGSGNSLKNTAFTSIARQIDLARFLNNTTENFNNLLNTGFNFAFFMKPATSFNCDVGILGSSTPYPGSTAGWVADGTGAFNTYYTGAGCNQVGVKINTLVSAGRVVTDAVFNGTATMTSATAAFTSADVGRVIHGSPVIVPGTTITVIGSGTSVTISTAATGSDSPPHIKLDDTTAYITIAPCPAQTLGTTYEHETDWDTTTYRSWQGVPGGTAVLCGSVTSSHRMVQGPFEEMSLPDAGPHQFWPDGSSNFGFAFLGDIDSIRIERNSVHTSAYTVPTTKFSAGSNDMLLENFPSSLDGTQLATNGFSGGANVYFTINGSASQGVGGDNIHDLEECANSNPGQGHLPDGIWAAGSPGGRWANLDCAGAAYVQHDFAFEDYNSHVSNVTGFGGHVGNVFDANPANLREEESQVDGTDIACEVWQGGGGGDHEVYHPKCTDRGGMRYGWIENQSSGNYYYPFIDSEVASDNWTAALNLLSPNAPYNIVGGNIATKNAAPWVILDDGGYGPHFVGTGFSDFGASSDPAEAINIINGTPTTPAIFTGVLIGSGITPVALSNQAGDPWVQAINNGTVSHPLLPLGTKAVSFDVSWANQDTISAVLGASSLAITFKNPTKNSIDYLNLCQDATGSRASTTFAAGTGAGVLKWAGGSAPSLTTTASKCDRLKFAFDGANLIGSLEVANF